MNASRFILKFERNTEKMFSLSYRELTLLKKERKHGNGNFITFHCAIITLKVCASSLSFFQNEV